MFSSKIKSEYFALFIFIAVPLLFGMGQEISAVIGGRDESYFIMRSVHLDLNGSHLAGIKEIFYPLFIRVSSLFGLGLRNFEEVCYGIALFFLWQQVIALTKSQVIAWGSVLPLVFFCYQHPLFNRSTYDALQLILLPLSFSSSIHLYCSKASWRSVLWAGVVVGFQVLTRAEGFLFILPPCISLIFVYFQSENLERGLGVIKNFLIKGLCILAILFLSQQTASLLNWTYCGFWAPTIMKSSSFQKCLSSLMTIDPELDRKIKYAPVPNVSLEKAYQISPAFLKAKPYFDKNTNGKGWSMASSGAFRPIDGSISGAHFQWALLDSGAFVKGESSDAVLKYFDQVSVELERGFKQGKIKKRFVVSTSLGPDFSIFDHDFGVSLWKVGRMFLNLSNPTMPQVAQEGDKPEIALIYNQVALRRTSLLAIESTSSTIRKSSLRISPIIISITRNVYSIARMVIFSSFFLLVILLVFKDLLVRTSLDSTPVILVFCLMLSIVLPRLVLLAAIDANMYPAAIVRYVATGVLSVWVFGFFCFSFVFYNAIRQLAAKLFNAPFKV